MARGDDIKNILYLAKNMRDSVQGYSIQMIQDECEVSRRTAMRIKNIISDVFEMEENPHWADTCLCRWHRQAFSLRAFQTVFYPWNLRFCLHLLDIFQVPRPGNCHDGSWQTFYLRRWSFLCFRFLCSLWFGTFAHSPVSIQKGKRAGQISLP